MIKKTKTFSKVTRLGIKNDVELNTLSNRNRKFMLRGQSLITRFEPNKAN